MEVTKELLLRVAELARLKLTDKDAEEFIPQLKEIVESFSKLDEEIGRAHV